MTQEAARYLGSASIRRYWLRIEILTALASSWNQRITFEIAEDEVRIHRQGDGLARALWVETGLPMDCPSNTPSFSV
jgi:hypothetical protein